MNTKRMLKTVGVMQRTMASMAKAIDAIKVQIENEATAKQAIGNASVKTGKVRPTAKKEAPAAKPAKAGKLLKAAKPSQGNAAKPQKGERSKR